MAILLHLYKNEMLNSHFVTGSVTCKNGYFAWFLLYRYTICYIVTIKFK